MTGTEITFEAIFPTAKNIPITCTPVDIKVHTRILNDC